MHAVCHVIELKAMRYMNKSIQLPRTAIGNAQGHIWYACERHTTHYHNNHWYMNTLISEHSRVHVW